MWNESWKGQNEISNEYPQVKQHGNWNIDLLKMYILLKMGNFHFHVSLPEFNYLPPTNERTISYHLISQSWQSSSLIQSHLEGKLKNHGFNCFESVAQIPQNKMPIMTLSICQFHTGSTTVPASSCIYKKQAKQLRNDPQNDTPCRFQIHSCSAFIAILQVRHQATEKKHRRRDPHFSRVGGPCCRVCLSFG